MSANRLLNRYGQVLSDEVVDRLKELGLVHQSTMVSYTPTDELREDQDVDFDPLEEDTPYTHEIHVTRLELVKVIFADYRFLFLIEPWSSEYLKYLDQLIKNLDVYIWDGKELVQAQDNNDLRCIIQHMQPAAEKTLTAALLKKGWVKDQVRIIDYNYANKIELPSTLWASTSKQQVSDVANHTYQVNALEETFVLRDLNFIEPAAFSTFFSTLNPNRFTKVDVTLCIYPDGKADVDLYSHQLYKIFSYLTHITGLIFKSPLDIKHYLVHLPIDKMPHWNEIYFSEYDVDSKEEEKQIKNLMEFFKKHGRTPIIKFLHEHRPSISRAVERLEQTYKSKFEIVDVDFYLFGDRGSEAETYYNCFALPEQVPFKTPALTHYFAKSKATVSASGAYCLTYDPTLDIELEELLEELATGVIGCNTLELKNFTISPGKYRLNPAITSLKVDNCVFEGPEKSVLQFYSSFPNIIHHHLVLHRTQKVIPIIFKPKQLKSYHYTLSSGIVGLVTQFNAGAISVLKSYPDLISIDIGPIEVTFDESSQEFKDFRFPPGLLKARFNLLVRSNAVHVANLIKKLPKTLQYLELVIDFHPKPGSSKSFDEDKLQMLIDKHFDGIKQYNIFINERKPDLALPAQPVPELKFSLETSDEKSYRVQKVFYPNPMAASYFDSRQARQNFYKYNGQTGSIVLDPAINTYKHLMELKESGLSALAYVKNNFENLCHPYTQPPLVFYSHEFNVRSEGFYPLLSPGPQSKLYREDFLSTSHPVTVFHSSYRNTYGIYVHKNPRYPIFSMSVNAIYYHPKADFPLVPSIDSRAHEWLRAIRFDEKHHVKPASLNEQWQSFSSDQLFTAFTQYLRGFSSNELPELKELKKIEDKYNVIWQKEAGICSQRSEFFMELAAVFGLSEQVEVVTSFITHHEWIEIIKGDERYTIELRLESDGTVQVVELSMADAVAEEMKEAIAFETEPVKDIKKALPEAKSVAKKQIDPIIEKYESSIPKFPTETATQFFPALQQALVQQRKIGIKPQALLILPEYHNRFGLYTDLLKNAGQTEVCVVDNLNYVKATGVHKDEKGKQPVPGYVHRFLQSAKEGDVLVMNLGELDRKPAQYGYNSTIDSDERKLDGTTIPDGVTVLWITNERCKKTLGGDTNSRFSPDEGLIIHLPYWPVEIRLNNPLRIELDERSDWLKFLIKNYLFEEKYAGRDIVFINPPVDDAFKTFVATGIFEYNGKTYRWQGSMDFQTEAYQFDTDMMGMKNEESKTWDLNATTFQYHNSNPSIIDQLDDGDTILLKTSLKNEGQWALWLKSCREKNKTFFYEILPNVNVPSAIESHVHRKQRSIEEDTEMAALEDKRSQAERSIDQALNTRLHVIECSDPSYVVAYLNRKPNTVMYAVTQKMDRNLIEYPIVVRDEKNRLSVKTVEPGAILHDLIEEKPPKIVVARGEFSNKFQDVFASVDAPSPYLMFLGKPVPIKGTMMIVTDNSTDFVNTASRTRISVDPESVWRLLALEQGEHTLFSAFKKQMSTLVKLPAYDVLCNLWENYKLNPRMTLTGYNLVVRQEMTEAVFPVLTQQQRLQQMAYLLQQDTIRSVFLIGHTSTGKTSLMEKYLPAYIREHTPLNLTVLFGLKKISEFVSTPRRHNEVRVLFIDEANLEDLSRFAGIYDKHQPHIVDKGKKYPLEPWQKVYYAGNLGYANRCVHQLLECAYPVFFRELEFKDIFEHELKPILQKVISDATDMAKVEAVINKAYALRRTPNAKPITARNLKHIALLFADRWDRKKETLQSTLEEVTKIAIKNLLPKGVIVCEEKIPIPLVESLRKEKFCLTAQHRATISYLEALKAGVNGILLIGPFSAGKSAAAVAYLKATGHIQVDINNKNYPEHSNCFVVLTYSNAGKFSDDLSIAFQRRWKVVINEFNTAVFESTLNLYLSKDAPGFAVIGTMNPGAQGGRLRLSDACLNRFVCVEIEEDTPEELNEKLQLHLGKQYSSECQSLVEYEFKKRAMGESLGLRALIKKGMKNIAMSIPCKMDVDDESKGDEKRVEERKLPVRDGKDEKQVPMDVSRSEAERGTKRGRDVSFDGCHTDVESKPKKPRLEVFFSKSSSSPSSSSSTSPRDASKIPSHQKW